MPKAISQKQFDTVFALLHPAELHERMKQRDIAHHTGVSERTVWSIANGKISRPAVEDAPPADKPRMHDGIEFKLVSSYRCSGCGHEVTLQPCLLCHERAKRKQKF